MILDGLTPAQVAQAWYHSYELLSLLFLEGITKTTLPIVQAVSELARYLPEPIDVDGLAATHYQLFGFNVFPFESIFLDKSGLLGGDVTEHVVRDLLEFSFSANVSISNPDHVGQELAALAYLCLVEEEALNKQPGMAVPFQQHQLAFLQSHLLRWLVPFTLAVKMQGVGFFLAVTELTFDLVSHHYESLLEQVGQELSVQGETSQ